MNVRAIALAAIPSIPMLCIAWTAMAGQVGHSAPAMDGSSKVFAALDVDHDGDLSPEEFRKGYSGLRQAIALEVRLREQFQAIDADRSGALDAAEYASLALVKRAGQTAPGLPAFDANKDQKLEFEEYLAAVRALFVQGRKARENALQPENESRERR